MEKITQEFGIDASQALAVLDQLDKGFSRFESRMDSLAKSIGKTGTDKQFAQLGQAAKQNLPATTQQVEKLTTSLGLLSRVVFTQAIVRALSQLRNLITDVASEAVKLQKSLALISTIDDSGRSLDQLGKSVKDLSDEFNIPLLEASAGLYQTISNQVGSTAESLQFLGEAAKFAKATNSSLESSVDLLSGALKSFQLDVSESDRVASTFFKAIDLGRLTADKLANGFGRVGPRAAALGLSLEEVGASLSAISVKGTNTNESITFLSGILTGLQKPSKAMVETLREMGFTSAEVAIKTRGLGGLLDDLSKATGGSAEQMAKLFPNVRGLGGAVSLTSGNLKTFTSNLREMEQAGKDFNDQAFLKIDTDAERTTAALNRLKNEMVTGLGQAALKLADGFLKLGGGIENIISTIRGDVLVDNALASLREKQAADAIALKAFEDNLAKASDKAAEADKQRLQSALQLNQALNRQYQIDAQNFQSAADRKAAIARFQAKTPVDENQLGLLLGKGANAFSTPDQVSQALIELEQRAEKLRVKINQAVSGEQGIQSFRGNIDLLFNQIDQLSPKLGSVLPSAKSSEFLNRNRAAIDALTADLKTLSAQSSVSEEDLLRVSNAFKALGKDALSTTPGQLRFGDTVIALGAIIEQLQNIKGIQKDISGVDFVKDELAVFEDVLQQAAPSAEQLKSAFQATDVAAFRANASLGGMAGSAERTAAAMKRAADEAAKINEFTGHSLDPFASGSVNQFTGHVNRMFGGPMFLADGGFARGSDTIPAMLSPGEFVVNPQSSARFFSQLQAMNAGKTPVFRQDGGTINQNIGDINLSVTGGDSSELTVRKIASGLKREFRRRGAIL